MDLNTAQIKVANFLRKANGTPPDDFLTLYLAALVLDAKVGDLTPATLSYVAQGAAMAAKIGLMRGGDVRKIRELVRILRTECGK